MKCRGSYGAFGGTNSTSLSIGSLVFKIGRGPFLHCRKQHRKMLKQIFEKMYHNAESENNVKAPFCSFI